MPPRPCRAFAPGNASWLMVPGTIGRWTASEVHSPNPIVHLSRWSCRQSSSNTRWKARQGKDLYAREAKVQGLKSRAAFKLLELDSKYRLFKKGQVVVDLGYAPGSWSQVAAERTKPSGTVIGIDLIPAQPPRGVSTIQGNFLLPQVQSMVKDFLTNSHRKAALRKSREREESNAQPADPDAHPDADIIEDRPSYIDLQKATVPPSATPDAAGSSANGEEAPSGRLVNIVLSDMMMNTSGIGLRDHAGSMDLCSAALQFASDTLVPGGHFVCKFYQGSEDKDLEKRLRRLFAKVHREKPESSRKDSKEAFFVALDRKADVRVEDVVD